MQKRNGNWTLTLYCQKIKIGGGDDGITFADSQHSRIAGEAILDMAKSYYRVAAFIDWNSQILLSKVNSAENPLAAAHVAFKNTAKRISKCLTTIDPERQFVVDLRFYHGWHKGFEPSANRKAITQVISDTDFSALSDKRAVVFSAIVGFGDCLLSALPSRMHNNLSIHLPNTLRDRGKGNEEKMVDTALAADLIVTAYQEPGDWILVAAEDDDLIPPLFVAEAIGNRAGSRVLLLSKRIRSKNFLKLDNISMDGQ